MAKADLRKTEVDPWRQHIGRAVERARLLRGWSLKELADAVGRNERQVARWINGQERLQLDALFAPKCFRQSLVVALAEMAGEGIEIATHITVRKTA